MTEIIEGLDTFSSASDLIGYIDIHKETPRALVLTTHIVQLAFLADLDLSNLSREALFGKREFVSLHSYDTEEILLCAKERLRNNLIPNNWKESFVAFFENKDKKDKE